MPASTINDYLLTPDLRVEGWQEVRAVLYHLRTRQLRTIVNKAARGPAKPVLATAKALAPIGETRQLVRRMRIRTIKPRRSSRGTRGQTIGVRVRTGSREEMGIPDDATGYYPAAQEYGWQSRDGTVHKPNPSFMRPAYWRHHASAEAQMKRNVIAGIDEAVRAGRIVNPF